MNLLAYVHTYSYTIVCEIVLTELCGHIIVTIY
jgi:hypothetical protein